MAISTPTAPLNAFSTANASTYDTAVATLTSGRLYFMVVHGYSTSPAVAVSSIPHDPAGTPLAFARATDGTTTANVDPWDATDHRTLEVWRVIPGSTTASALIRITWAASQSAMGWTLVEITSGFDSGAPIVQVVKASGAAGNTASVTMATFGATDNLTLFSVANGTGTAAPGEAFAATEGRTELAENDETERAEHAVHYQNPHGSDVSLNSTWTNNEDWAAIGIEVKAGSNDITSTGGLSVPAPGVVASALLTFAATAALAVAQPAVAASALETFTSTAALTVPTPSVAGSGALTFTATGALVVPMPVVAGTAEISGVPITSTGALNVPAPAVAGSASETFSGSGALSVPRPSVAGTATETFAGSAALQVGQPSVAGSALETFTGSGSLAVPAPSVAGSGAETFTGSGALLVPQPAVAGTATISGDAISSTGALLVPQPSVSGSASLGITLEVVDQSGPRYTVVDQSGPRYNVVDQSDSRFSVS